jgi:hypothetical protein
MADNPFLRDFVRSRKAIMEREQATAQGAKTKAVPKTVKGEPDDENTLIGILENKPGRKAVQDYLRKRVAELVETI